MPATQQGFWSTVGGWNSEYERWVVNGRVMQLLYYMQQLMPEAYNREDKLQTRESAAASMYKQQLSVIKKKHMWISKAV